MPITGSAVVLGTFKSKAALVTATHSAASAEVHTISHGLGATPDFATSQLRTVTIFGGGPVAGSSTGLMPAMAFRSANASQAIFDGVGGGAYAAGSPSIGLFDYYFEVSHSIVK